MNSPREMSFMSRGLRLQAKVWGIPGDRPCLAIAGWLDNANSFDRLAPLLPGLHLVALDLPGHGTSAHRSADAQYHFIDWLDAIGDVVEALLWQRFVFIGHSMGAAVASLWAGAFPETVDRLILLDGLGPLTAEASLMPERTVAHVSEQRRLPRKKLSVYPDRHAAAVQLSRVVPNLSVESAEILVARGTREVSGGVTWSADPRLRGTSSMRLTEPQVLAFMQRITCPTLLVRARDGYPFNTEQMAGRAAAISRLRQVGVDGGHHVHLEDPVAVAATVTAFLRDADANVATMGSAGPHSAPR